MTQVQHSERNSAPQTGNRAGVDRALQKEGLYRGLRPSS